MQQNIVIAEQGQEREYLVAHRDSYIFDLNLLILSDNIEQLEQVFSVKLQVDNHQQYYEQRQKFITKLLCYQHGVEILLRLIFRHSDHNLLGQFEFQAVEELSFNLMKIAEMLIRQDCTIKHDLAIKMANRILRLVKAIKVRKQREINSYQQRQSEMPYNIYNKKAYDDLEKASESIEQVQRVKIYLENIPFYEKHEQIINQLYQNVETLIYKFIQQSDSLFQEFEDQMQYITYLSYYQQQLLIQYIELYEMKNNQRNQEHYNLFTAIWMIDNKQDKNKIIELLGVHELALEQWKIVIIQYLVDIEQYQFAYDILLVSRINWNDLNNSDIIIKLLIHTNRSLQAYLYASEALKKSDRNDVFVYFVEQMIEQNQFNMLWSFDYSQNEDEILSKLIEEHQENPKLCYNFILNLIQHKKLSSAIKFRNKILNKSVLQQVELQELQIIIKRETQNLSQIEQNFYNKMMSCSQCDITEEEKDMVDFILNNESTTKESLDNKCYFIKEKDQVIPLFESRNIIYKGCRRKRMF